MRLVITAAILLMLWLITQECNGGLVYGSNSVKPLYNPVGYQWRIDNTLQVVVKLERETKASTTFMYKPPLLSCEQGTILNYTLTVHGDKVNYHRVSSVVSQNCKDWFQLIVTDLPREIAYTAYLTVKSDNNHNYAFKSEEVFFTTTEVQSASIIKGNHHVYILCQLSLGSRAKGCRVYMQIMNSFSSTSTETQLLSIPRKVDLYPARAEHCIRLPKTLIAGGFQVFDWNEQDGIGSVQVPSTVIKSMYAPCYVTSTSSAAWQETSHMILFILSAMFMIIGTITIFIGLLCRLGRLHRHFRRESYKVLQGDTIENGDFT